MESIVKKGKGGAHKIRNAQILLHSDENGTKWPVLEIAKLLHCNKDTVCEAPKRLVTRGFAASLERKTQEKPSVERLFDGEAEARLLQIARIQPRRQRRNGRRLIPRRGEGGREGEKRRLGQQHKSIFILNPVSKLDF